jgi:LAO/AO transport system kinase
MAGQRGSRAAEGSKAAEGSVGEKADLLCEAALAGDRRALARLLTAVENRTPLAEAALRRLYPRAGHAQLIGVTGPPGAGKSTLVAALIAELRRAGRPVAVVAVDPSSPITGGAVLGDRVRMQAYTADPDVFIRSMASRGHSGGLSSATTAAAAVFDAVGFDAVLIETVGTGQSEVEVAAAADTTVVVEAPDMGDEIQAIKAGLLEVADIIVVNKGDRPGAHRTAGQLLAMLSDTPRETRPGRPAPKNPKVLVTAAATGEGVAELLAAIDRHRSATRGSDGESARLKRAEAQVWAVLVDRLHERVRSLEGAEAVPPAAVPPAAVPPAAPAAGELLRAVASHDIDPYAAADAILDRLVGDASGSGRAVAK